MSKESVRDRLENQKEEITAGDVGEAALFMTANLGGAFAGTIVGTAEAIKKWDIEEFEPAFSEIASDVSEDLMEDLSPGGLAAVEAIDGLWKEYISENVDESLVEPNVQNRNPLIAAIGKASGEGLPMFLGMKGLPVKSTARGIRLLTNKTAQKIRRTRPDAKEALVDVETGEPVITPDAPLSDKGASMNALKEFVKVAQDPSVSPNEGVGRILKPLFYKPVQVLRDWNSPTLNKIADAIYAPTKADASIGVRGIDLIDSTSKAHGKFSQAWDKIIEPYKGRFNTVKRSAGEAITRGLRTNKVPKKYRESVLQAREFLDVFLSRYVQRVLPDVGVVENYVPQLWNVPYILKRQKRFSNFLQKTWGMSVDVAETTMRRIVEAEGSPEFYEIGGRLVNAADAPAWIGRVRQKGGASQKSFEQSRKLDIPETSLSVAEEFLVNNIGDLIPTYIRNATKRVEYARRFGPKEEKLNAGVAKAIEELGIENNIKAIDDLTADVYGLADALQGKYRPIKSLSLNKWNRRVANYETVLHLGLVSLASFPETAAPAIQFGFVPRAYAKGVAHAFIEATGAAERVFRGKRSIPKLKAAKALESMGAISLTPLQSIQAARFTSVTSHFTSRFMHATGLELLTDAQRVIAYETLSTILARNAKQLATGKAGKNTKFYTDQLKELGVNPAQATQWFKDGMPKTGRLADLMENAKLRGQRWAVTMPSAATKPLMFSDPHFVNILLFKSFTSVFSNLFMKRALKELQTAPTLRKAGVIGAMVAATTIAYYTQYLRERIAGYDTGMSEVERWSAGIDRAALTGPFTYAYVLANPYRFGFTDSSAKRLFNLLGPVGTDFAKVMDIVTNNKMSKKRRARELAKLVPIANITGGSREETADAIEALLP